MFVDDRLTYLSKPRALLSMLVMPVQWLADGPKRLHTAIIRGFISRTTLIEENERLRVHNLLLEQKLQKLASLSVQNKRLLALLNSSQHMKGKVKIATIIGVNPDPQTHQVTIDRGTRSGAFVGQPVLDASGVLGQIIGVNYFSSRILLITDSSSRIPIEINRTGYQAVAAGNFSGDTLSLLHVPHTVDVRVGDLLVSSGLDGRFPAGYPVATVDAVIKKSGEHFVSINATPIAKINNARLVLVLFSCHKIVEDKPSA